MPETPYPYSISADFPGGAVNTGKLDAEIRASSIVTALDRVDTAGNLLTVVFKAALSPADKTILDGDAAGPAAGLIVQHDSTPYPTPVSEVVFPSPQFIFSKPTPFGDRLWHFSHNFCDKTTWYGDSLRVVAEAVGNGNGVQQDFPLVHPNAIDVTHGKITDETRLVPNMFQGGATYAIEVSVNGVVKTEADFGEDPALFDYTVDYAAGTIHFNVPPPLAQAVVATYFYSPLNAGSTMHITPKPGKKWVLSCVEIQFATNIDLTDEVRNGIFTYNPGLGAPPAKFLYPPSLSVIKRAVDYVNWTRGSFPLVPAFGGATRGFAVDCMQLRWDYISPVPLDSSIGAELRIWQTHHRPFGGAYGYATAYGIEESV